MSDEKWMQLTKWMYEWMKEWWKLGKIEFMVVLVFCRHSVS